MKARNLSRNPAPPSWATDDLSAFFEAARSNMFAGCATFPKIYQRMVALDQLFQELFVEFSEPEHDLGATFAMRCQSALYAAAQLSLSGQVPECFMVLRGALEFALYAHYISSSPRLQVIWLDRHQSVEARKLCGKTFGPTTMLDRLARSSDSLASRAKVLYELSIDYGAHPNTKAVFHTLTILPLEDGTSQFTTDFLTESADLVRFGLLSWELVASNCLEVFGLVFPKRYEFLGFATRIEGLRQATANDAIAWAKSE